MRLSVRGVNAPRGVGGGGIIRDPGPALRCFGIPPPPQTDPPLRRTEGRVRPLILSAATNVQRSEMHDVFIQLLAG